MKRTRRTLIGLVVVMAMVLMSLGTTSALAAPPAAPAAVDPVKIEFTGAVVAIDAEAGTVNVEVEVAEDEFTTLVVQAPEGFDFSALAVDDIVEVEGTLGEGGVVVASKLVIETEDEDDEDDEDQDDEDDEDDEDEDPDVTPTATVTPTVVLTPTVEVTGTVGPYGEKGNRFCWDTTRTHPVAQGIADSYGVDYAQVMTWFCHDKVGFGQIMLALQTATAKGGKPEVDDTEETDDDEDTDGDVEDEEDTESLADLADTYLQRRDGGEGWGNIWKDLGLNGKSRKAGPPPEEDAEDTEDGEDEDGEDAEADETPDATESLMQQQSTKGNKGNGALKSDGGAKGQGKKGTYITPDKVKKPASPKNRTQSNVAGGSKGKKGK